MNNSLINANYIRPIIAMLLFLSIFISCKKDSEMDENALYRMSFKANNNFVEYTLDGALLATFSKAGNQYLLTISGYDIGSNLNLQIYNDEEITENTYSGFVPSSSALVGVSMGYQDNSTTIYTRASTDTDVIIHVNSITETAVSGTFSGTVKASGKADISITEGKFNVKRYN